VPIPVLEVDLGPGVLAGFTSRAGGVSRDAWSGLDLGLHVGDDPEHVRRNRDLLAGWAGTRVRFVNQVHGPDVLVLTEAAAAPVAHERAPDCDAAVAALPGPAVGVLVADCVPVLLADADARVVGAAHAGRRGLLAGVLQRTVQAMVRHGALPGRIRAAVGPAAGACCYEVPEQLRAEATAVLPEVWARTRSGTPSLDLASGCRAALASVGVQAVQVLQICTIDDEGYYSYRRAAVTGRCAGVVRALP
jgi:polyphenol oxidase